MCCSDFTPRTLKGEKMAFWNSKVTKVKFELSESERERINVGSLAVALGRGQAEIRRALDDPRSPSASMAARILATKKVEGLVGLWNDAEEGSADQSACVRALGWATFRKPA